MIQSRTWDRSNEEHRVEMKSNKKSWMWSRWAERYRDQQLNELNDKEMATIVEFSEREMSRLHGSGDIVGSTKMASCMATGLISRGVEWDAIPSDWRFEYQQQPYAARRGTRRGHCERWLCPRCENRRSGRRVRAARDAMRRCGALEPKHFTFITLNMERTGGEPLAEQVSLLDAALRRFRSAPYFAGHVEGAIAFLDCNIPWGWQFEPIRHRVHAFAEGRGETIYVPAFNAHWHIIAYGEQRLSAAAMTDEWSLALRDRRGQAYPQLPRSWRNIEAFCRYSAEHDYARVAAGLHDHDRDELVGALARVQMVRSSGVFRQSHSR